MKLTEGFNLLATAPHGIKRLRELILSLAVQGKLVPQDPSDEPASELLKHIRAEKDRLIAEGKIKNDKPLPAIGEDEKTFELPQGWEWIRLGTVGEVVGGGTPKSDNPEYWTEGGIPWLTPADLYGRKEKFVQSGRRDISRSGLENSSAKLMPAGTVLFSSRAPIGYVAIAAETLATNQGFKSVVPHAKGLSNYIYWYLKYSGPAIDANASGTTFKEISGRDFSKIEMSLPPLAEQSRIVAKVEELMALCDALETRGKLEAEQHVRLTATLFDTLAASESAHQLQENWARLASNFDLVLDRPEAVDALEQTLLQLAVRGLLVEQNPNDEPAIELLKQIRAEKDRLIGEGKIKKDKPLPAIGDDEKPFELPQGWEWVRFGDIADISSGVTLGRKTAISTPISLPYLRVANVQRWKLILHDVKELVIDKSELERFSLKRGDLLITEGGDWDKVGRTCVWEDNLPICLHQNHVFKVRATYSAWNYRWAELYLNSTAARAYFASSAKQTTNLASINSRP